MDHSKNILNSTSLTSRISLVESDFITFWKRVLPPICTDYDLNFKALLEADNVLDLQESSPRWIRMGEQRPHEGRRELKVGQWCSGTDLSSNANPIQPAP